MTKSVFDEYGCEISWTSVKDDNKIYFLKDKEGFKSQIKDEEAIEYLSTLDPNNLTEDNYMRIFEILKISPIKPFKRLLRLKKVSGYSLSEATGIPQQTVSSWTSGANDVRLAAFSRVKKVADHLGITMEELWEEIDV